jgi:hypothetical protein
VLGLKFSTISNPIVFLPSSRPGSKKVDMSTSSPLANWSAKASRMIFPEAAMLSPAKRTSAPKNSASRW